MFHTVRHFWHRFQVATGRVPVVAADGAGGAPAVRRRAWWEIILQITVSLAVAAVGLYIIVSGRFDPKTKEWAFGSVGTVLGYWLR